MKCYTFITLCSSAQFKYKHFNTYRSKLFTRKKDATLSNSLQHATSIIYIFFNTTENKISLPGVIDTSGMPKFSFGELVLLLSTIESDGPTNSDISKSGDFPAADLVSALGVVDLGSGFLQLRRGLFFCILSLLVFVCRIVNFLAPLVAGTAKQRILTVKANKTLRMFLKQYKTHFFLIK